jgi:hypothetical protein
MFSRSDTKSALPRVRSARSVRSVAFSSSPTPKEKIRAPAALAFSTAERIAGVSTGPTVASPSVRKKTIGTRPSLRSSFNAATSASWIAVPPVASSPSTKPSAAFTFSAFASTTPSRKGRGAVANATTLNRSFGPSRPSA